MIRKSILKKIFIALLWITIFTGTGFVNNALSDADSIIGTNRETYFPLAIRLYSDGYYEESRTLLLELLYSNSLAYPLNYYSKILIGTSYGREGKPSRSLKELLKLRNSLNSLEEGASIENLLCEASYCIAYIYFYTKKFDRFLTEAENLEYLCNNIYPEIIENMGRMELSTYIYMMKWQKALKLVKIKNLLDEKTRTLLEKSLIETIKHRPKSPVLGGVLSIIPGLGHIYAGMYWDGIRSILFNFSFGLLTLYSYKHGEYLFSAGFGIIESILYVSNIYGGINAVKHSNRNYYINKRNSMLKHIHIKQNLEIKIIRKDIGL